MQKLFIAIVLIFTCSTAIAQSKLVGEYNREYKWFISSDTGILVKKFHGNRAAFMIKGNNPFRSDSNRVGFIDTTGKIVVKPVYMNCSNFYMGRALVENTARQIGIINDAGEVIIPLRSQSIRLFENGLFLLSMREPYTNSIDNPRGISLVDRNNHTIIPFGRYSAHATPPPVYFESTDDVGGRSFNWEPEIFEPSTFFKKYIGVKKGQKWAVINTKGQEIIPPKFDGIGIFSNNIMAVKLGQKFGVANISGKILIPALYDRISLTGKDYLYVYNGTKMGVLSLHNKTIIPIDFDEIIPFGKGFTAYKKERKTMLYANNGERIAVQERPMINFPYWGNKESGFFVYNSNEKAFRSYQNLLDFNNIDQNGGRKIFYFRNNLWGIMDSTGREITLPLYNGFDRENLNLTGKSNRLIAVQKGNKWGLIDDQGKLLLRIIYERILYNSQDQAYLVTKDGKQGMIDKNMKTIIQPNYYYISHSYRNFYDLHTRTTTGLAKLNGQIIADALYTKIEFCGSKIILRKDNKFGTIDLEGKVIDPFIYNNIQCRDGELVKEPENKHSTSLK